MTTYKSDKAPSNNKKKVSAYTYVRNANEMNYPFIESITSFVKAGIDEVVVLDTSDKDEGTTDLLLDLVDKYPDVIKAYQAEVNWNAPNFGIWDGQSKAMARSHCTNPYLIQFDTDEFIEEQPDVMNKIQSKCIRLLGNENPIMALPVVEYWGSQGKVRMDINPWKERISISHPHITHGIPMSHRHYQLDKNTNASLLYSRPGSDGCNMIDSVTGQPIPISNPMIGPNWSDINNARVNGRFSEIHCQIYEDWFNQVVEDLPTIFHFSWWSVEVKIKKYQAFFNSFWKSLYGDSAGAPAVGWNPFFPERFLDQVSEEEIEFYAQRIERESGGHIFHQAWNGEGSNHVTIHKAFPKIMENWCRENKTGSKHHKHRIK